MNTTIAIVEKYPWKKFVTVQVRDDDVLAFCNHAGHRTESVTANAGQWDEFETLMEVCNKCGAQSEDGEEWYE